MIWNKQKRAPFVKLSYQCLAAIFIKASVLSRVTVPLVRLTQPYASKRFKCLDTTSRAEPNFVASS